MILSRGWYMRNTADNIPDLENIRNADMNELCAIFKNKKEVSICLY